MQRNVTAAGLVVPASGEARDSRVAEDARSAEARRPDQPPIAGPKMFGAPVLRILSRASGETVGHLYEWDNGDRQPLWVSEPVKSVTYAPLPSAAPSATASDDDASQM